MRSKGIEVATAILSDKRQGASLPTDLQGLLRGESVVVESFATNHRFEGCIKLIERVPTIFVNHRGRGSNDARARFTLAHEIGHFFLHRQLIRRGRSFFDRTISLAEDQADELEREANDFASEVLLPPLLVRRFLSGGFVRLERIEELATRAQASLQATAIKVARESRSRFCIFFERDGLVAWSAASDDWRFKKLPWQRWRGEPLPAESYAAKLAGSFEEEKVLRRVWHPNDPQADEILFESALATPYGRLILVADDLLIED